MTNKPAQTQDKFVLRLPDGLRDQIKASAEQNNRSMNAEIVVAIQMFLGITSSSHSPLNEDGNFLDSRGLPEEEQLRRIVEKSAKILYLQLQQAMKAPTADISNPPDWPPSREE
jgi:hypothetical protein